MAKKKFCRVDNCLRIAVAVVVEGNFPNLAQNTPGVAEIRPYPPRNSQKAYLDLSFAGTYPQEIKVRVPEILEKATWGEIMFNNNKTGAQVLFGRKGEEKPFGPEGGKYVCLRLYRENEHPFKSIFVRVDKGDETYFFALKARWEGKTITIEIERDPSHIPQFLS